jgi:Bacterial protein of unknown function (DUF922)
MAVNVIATPPTLSWSNFTVVDSSPDLSGDEVAQIHPEIRFPGNMQTVPTNGIFKLNSFTITVSPVAADTIVLASAAQTADLLKHEQGHYDLLVIGAKALAADLTAASDPSSPGLAAKVQTIRNTHMTRASAIDTAYDTQTNHGQNAAQQTGWNLAIATGLASPNPTTIQGMKL